MFNIDKLFNKILNRINLNYLSFFFLLSLIDLLIYGINNHDYQLYNLDPLFRSRIIDGILNFNNYFITNNLSLQYYYIKYLTPILEYGIIFIIASIIIKFFIYVIVYKLAFHQTRDKSHSILISVLLIGAASLLTNGSVLNGIWGSPIIMPASLSTVFSLLSLYYFLKNKYVIASILISISIHFHSLYAMTFYAWLFIGLVMIEYKINNFKYIKNFIFGSVIIIINIVYISIISGYSDANFVGSNISLNQWYEKIRTINPDDVFLLYNIRLFGATLLPPILLGSYLSIKSKNKSPYDFLMIGIFLSLILFCFIEFLQNII